MRKQGTNQIRQIAFMCAVIVLMVAAVLSRLLKPALRPAEAGGDPFGMVLIDIADEETAASYHVTDCGVYVLAVEEESPADVAGVSSGDLLVSVNALPVQNTAQFASFREAFQQGECVELTFQRRTCGNPYAVELVWNEE